MCHVFGFVVFGLLFIVCCLLFVVWGIWILEFVIAIVIVIDF
jgi:hypothetical protein